MIKRKYEVYIDCADCARKVEDAVNEFGDIKSACVDFLRQVMLVEFYDFADIYDLEDEINRRCKKIDPDFEMSLKS